MVKPGDEGAVVVEISNLLIGQSRPWSYRQDTGSGKADTVVYPVKVTYTVKTLYRKATEIEANWVRIMNVYVDSFGEWRIGSEEAVQSRRFRAYRRPEGERTCRIFMGSPIESCVGMADRLGTSRSEPW